MHQLISTENAAQFLGVTRPTVIKYIQDGRLDAVRTGKAYKISRNGLEKFARETGINGQRLAELDQFLRQRDKKTRNLASGINGAGLRLHDEPQQVNPEPDVYYYLGVRTHPQAREIIFRVNTVKFFVGRHSLASLSIQDPYVSTLHTTLIYQDGLIKVLDQSTNGTLIHQKVLTSGKSQVLGDDDQFQVGGTILSIVCPRKIDSYLGFDS